MEIKLFINKAISYLFLFCFFNKILGERYCPSEADQWQEMTHMFSPRSNFATVILDDKIFVIGGFNGK